MRLIEIDALTQILSFFFLLWFWKISEIIFVLSSNYFKLNYTCSRPKWPPDYNCSKWQPVYHSQICGATNLNLTTLVVTVVLQLY